MKCPSCLLIALLIVCYSNNAASCEASAQVTRLESHFLQRKPLERIIPPPTVREGQCIQQQLIERLTHQLGPVAGYKAGLTSEVVRRRFSVTEPVSGALLRDMLLTDGASVSIDFGAKGFMEIDVIVVVGKAQALQAARDPVEAANFIVAFHPFLELPDWVF